MFLGRGAKIVKFYFSLTKLGKQPFFAKKILGNVKFQNPGGPRPLLPTTMVIAKFYDLTPLNIFCLRSFEDRCKTALSDRRRQ